MNLPSLTTLMRTVITPHPSRDWMIILGITIILGASLIGIAAYFFVGIQSGAIIVPTGSVATPRPLPTADLDKALATYGARATNYAAGNIHATTVPDPAR